MTDRSASQNPSRRVGREAWDREGVGTLPGGDPPHSKQALPLLPRPQGRDEGRNVSGCRRPVWEPVGSHAGYREVSGLSLQSHSK